MEADLRMEEARTFELRLCFLTSVRFLIIKATVGMQKTDPGAVSLAQWERAYTTQEISV